MMYTMHRAMGPNVLLDFDADGDNSDIQPHLNGPRACWSTMRWRIRPAPA